MKYERLLKFFQLSLFLAGMAFLAACLPRGETKSLDEVLEMAKGNYASLSSKIDKKAVPGLGELENELVSIETLSDSKELLAGSAKIADQFAGLLTSSGFTSRPAMTELINQFRTLAVQDDVTKDYKPQIKLLLSRTYTLLASELKGTGFRIQ